MAEKRKPLIEFPREMLWFEFWCICEIGMERKLFGWTDRVMPTTEALEQKFGRFDFKLNVNAYMVDFLENWAKRYKATDLRIERPDGHYEQFMALYEARRSCGGAFGTFFHVMRTAWFEMHGGGAASGS